MDSEDSRPRHRRVSQEEKAQAVLRLIRGDQKSTVADDLAVSVDRLERWHDRFLDGGRAALARKHHKSSSGLMRAKFGSVGQWAALLIVLTASIILLLRFLEHSSEVAP